MKIPKQAYTTEFKELAVKRVKGGQSISTVIKELGLGDQTLRNWVKASAEGKRRGAGGKVVTPEEMELSRLRVENLRLKRENEILKNRPSGIARPVWIETGCRHTLEPRKDSGRLLFGGILTPSKNLAQGKLRPRLWWRTT
jgi:transposase